MKKNIYTLNLPFTFNPQHKGAPYYISALEKWANHGEFCEIALKYALNLPYAKDANTRFDNGSDIPELQASVKSSRFTLTTAAIGNNFDEMLDNYFKRCHSNLWIYVVIVDEQVISYEMNAAEFRAFVKEFASVNSRGCIRAKADSLKMLLWLDERVTARKTSGFLSTIR